jgi:hypothetical protein
MAYKRTLKIRVDAPENILNTEATAVFDDWVDDGKIVDSGFNPDPDDANNIITWLTFINETECNEYFTLLGTILADGVDNANYTIIETINEHI